MCHCISAGQYSLWCEWKVSFKNSNAYLEDKEFQLYSKLNLFYSLFYKSPCFSFCTDGV